MSLEAYSRKRDFARTPEPPPGADPPPWRASPGQSGIFVVHDHHARAHHVDFRLERDGVLASWAIPKGLPRDPTVNHLAIKTEDHPLAYADFAGTIPAGEYGGGTMRIIDSGSYECTEWTSDDIKVVLHGRSLRGGYALFRAGENWLIHRERHPLPADLSPMLATSGTLPSTDAGWSYEMKWDGRRALAFVSGRRVKLLSRNGRDITSGAPELGSLAAALHPHEALLDGEIVAFADGAVSFEALQERMHVSKPSDRLLARVPLTYLVFDLVHLDGRPLYTEPYRLRRELLEKLALAGPSWHTAPTFPDASATDVLHASVQQGMEGIIAKRQESPYRPGVRSPDWIKIKNFRTQDVVVGGWRPGTGGRAGQIGSLHVGVHTVDGISYAGNVGTGFSDATLRMLAQRLAPLVTPRCPFVDDVPAKYARDATWVRPELVIEVRFARWSTDGKLVHPSYRGLREDKDPTEATRE